MSLTDQQPSLFTSMMQAPIGLCVLGGPLHTYEFANHAYQNFVGDRPLLGLPVRQALPDLDGQGFYELLDQVYSTGEAFVGREVLVQLDPAEGAPTERLFLDFTYEPRRNSLGDVDGIVVTAVDVTAKVQEREAIQARERALTQLILDAAGEGILGVNAVGETIFVNPTAAQLLGYQPDEMIGRNLHSVVHHSHADGSPYPYERCPVFASHQDGCIHKVSDEVFWRKDGASFPVEYTSTPILEGGRVVGCVVLFRDITERVESARRDAEQRADLAIALEELRKQVTLTSRLIAHTPAAIAYLDRDLVYRWNNPAHCRYLGLPAEEILDHSIAEVWPGAENALEPIRRQVMETGEPYFSEALRVVRRKDGREIVTHWDIAYVAIPGQDGLPEGVLGMATEVSERVENERYQRQELEALRQAEQMKDQFLSVMSHELRTPLNFIMGFASTLDDEVQGPLNEKQHKAVGRILAGSDRMLALVNDLLEYSKIQGGKFSLHKETEPYAPIVQDVVERMLVQAEQKGLSLVPAVAAEVTLPLDGQRIHQVLVNLVGNAIKFTREGRIELHVRQEGDRVVTEVSDTGVGIPPAKQAEIFARLQQIDMGNTREAGGVGLGLAISKAIVEAHGGTLSVSSQEGRGATFRFELPLVTEAASG